MAYSIPYEAFNEGKQAEEYKARKEKESNDTIFKNADRDIRRYPIDIENGEFVTDHPGRKNLGKRNDDGSVSVYRGKGDRTEYDLTKQKDIDRENKAYEKAGKEAKRRAEKWGKEIEDVKSGKADSLDKMDDAKASYYRLVQDKNTAIDAANRHIRRHPKQYREAGIFEDVQFLEPLEEGFISSVVLPSLALAGVCYVLSKKEKSDREKEKVKQMKERYKQTKKREEDFIASCKKHYGISIEIIEHGVYHKEEDLYRDMEKDVKSWVAKIINSDVFKEAVDSLLADPKKLEYILDDPKDATLQHFKSLFKVEEGVNGFEESMQICEGTQDEQIEFNWVTYDIAQMVELKYGSYLEHDVSCGDGDEGHIYYNMYMQ